MNIAVASDHAGFAYKNAIVEHLRGLGHTVQDFGTNSEASCDYPDFAVPACKSVVAGTNARAIVICGTGIGVSIAANKVHGMRCALAFNVDMARLGWEHNQAQALAIGARFTPLPTALAMVDSYLGATFEPRHQRRIDKISAIETNAC